MPTTATGVQNTNNVLSNRKIVDMAEKIALLDGNVSPLVKALTMFKKVPAKNTQIFWLEDDLRPRKTTCSGGATNVATTVNVNAGDGQHIKVGDVIRTSQAGENLYVTAVATDALTVTRSVGAVIGTAIAAGEELVVISNASAEGATLGTIKQTLQVAQSNFTQIQRDPYGFTESEKAIALYGGSEPTYEKGKKFIEHMRALETTAFYGQRDQFVGGSSPIGFAGGLIDYISTNSFSIGGNLTQATFELNLQQAFRYGSENKVLFCAPVFGRALSGWALGKLQVLNQGTNTKYGLEVATYTTQLGFNLDVVVKKDWHDFSTASNQGGSRAFLVDMANIEFNPLRDTKFLPDRAANDEDADKGEYLTEFSFRVKLEKAHAMWFGVTGGA